MLPAFPTTNMLLTRLLVDDAALLQPCLTRVDLTHRQVLVQAGTPIENVYFLENGVASVVEEFEDGAEAEVGLVGYEGLTGVSVILGVDRTPYRTYMQTAGATALQITVTDFLKSVGQSPSLHAVLKKYVHVVSIQAANTAAVNARFGLSIRLARWLLMCHDRVSGDDLGFTHDMIAAMLCVRRPGVTVALQTIEATGSISVHRGMTRVVNRAQLALLAHNSYGTSEKEYRRLIGSFGK